MFENLNTNPFNKNRNLLYHYTSAESFFKILSSMKLKFSRFDNLNDLNEIEVNFQIMDFHLELSLQNFIIENCGLLSFTKDYIVDSKVQEWGVAHARMWAQYASNNTGACIVINEEKLLNKNPELKNCSFYKFEDVIYVNWTNSSIVEKSSNPEAVLIKNYKNLFFKKNLDWELERERRLFILGELEFLDINNCVEYICLGFRFENYDELVNVILNNFNNQKQILTPHLFVKQINSYGRINPLDNSFKVLENIKKSYLNFDFYWKFLKENGY